MIQGDILWYMITYCDMATYGNMLLFNIVIYYRIWRCMVTYCDIWWYMVIYGYICRCTVCIVIYVDLLWFMVMYYDIWWHIVICGYIGRSADQPDSQPAGEPLSLNARQQPAASQPERANRLFFFSFFSFFVSEINVLLN